MLTPDALAVRLKDWATDFRANIRASDPSPIELYQRIFGLVHSLKASIQLSEDTAIQGLNDTALASDEVLVKLAYADLELTQTANANLYKLASQLDALEPLEVLLKTALPDAAPPTCLVPKLLELPYSWDAMSRARARSCTSHGYQFFTREDTTTLTTLPRLDSTIQAALAAVFGLVVVRRLDALAPQGTDLALNASVIAAVPAANSVEASTLPSSTRLVGWRQI